MRKAPYKIKQLYNIIAILFIIALISSLWIAKIFLDMQVDYNPKYATLNITGYAIQLEEDGSISICDQNGNVLN